MASNVGTIPLLWAASKPRQALKRYAWLCLRGEIRAEGMVRNLPGFSRFLAIAALYHGVAVNISGIARDCGVARSTVQGYLDILENALLAFRLPAFQLRLRPIASARGRWRPVTRHRARRAMRQAPNETMTVSRAAGFCIGAAAPIGLAVCARAALTSM